MSQPFKQYLRWLYPGMRVKRWLFLVIVGVFLISFGVSLIVSTPYFRSIYVLWRNFVFGFLNRYWLAIVLVWHGWWGRGARSLWPAEDEPFGYYCHFFSSRKRSG